ncbi:transposase [Actinomadura soli]|uniref:transposase n=1 Tax=Actinomadura soli TaxID=2508997 RepID=UPI0022A7475D|nr:transposase [Actinomadura soli]
MWVRDHLDGLWSDEDFTSWYPRDGRPGLSPAQLATVCVLRFLLNLSDRQAAEAVRCRIDFAADDRADRLLDPALERMRAAGLLKRRGRQRTDSTHVLAAVRGLTRLELITEARAALEELVRDASASRLVRERGRPRRCARSSCSTSWSSTATVTPIPPCARAPTATGSHPADHASSPLRRAGPVGVQGRQTVDRLPDHRVHPAATARRPRQ